MKNSNLSSKQHPSNTEKELRRTQEYLDTIFSHIPAGIAIMEGPEFRYWKVNSRLAEINGLSVEDHLGRPLAEVLPDAAPDIVPRLRQVVETGEPSSPFEFSAKLPKSPDETYWFMDTFFPIKGRNGKVQAVGAVVLEITARKRAETALQEAYEELERRVQERTQQLQKTQEELSSLSRHLIQAQETERRRIALELHDKLGSELALLSIGIEQVNQKDPESQAQSAERLQELARQIREISSQVQDMSHQLHPSQLLHLGLVAASRSLCKEVSKVSNVQIDFSHSDVPNSMSQDVSICLYRVLQESLGNMVKHSGAQEAQVTLTGRPDEIHLDVCDSGVGFDPEGQRETFGLGLISMRERINLVGGELLVESQPSRGTRIKACVSFRSNRTDQDQR